jgi:hypothetical protein
LFPPYALGFPVALFFEVPLASKHFSHDLPTLVLASCEVKRRKLLRIHSSMWKKKDMLSLFFLSHYIMAEERK